MGYKNAHGVIGSITTTLPNSLTATTMQLDLLSAQQLHTLLAAGDFTYLLIDTGSLCEVVKVSYSTTANFPIVRAQDGSNVNAHAAGARAAFVLTSAAVSSQVSPVPMTVNGTGLVEASTSGLVVDLNVAPPNFSSTGLQITGTWPDIDFAVTQDDTSCCGGSSSGSSGLTSLFGFGLVLVTQSGTTANITVPAPNFTSSDNTVSFSGAWPNIDFSAANAGEGTVTSVAAGTGIVVTGTATIAPIVSLTTSGVTPGSYGGITVDVYGRMTAVDPAFNPPSSIISGSSAITSARVGNVQTLTAVPAAEGVVGVAAFADSSAPLDPTDHTTAVNPALLASVIDALAVPTVTGVSNYTPVATALYTNIVAGALLAVDIPSGESMLVHVHGTMVNTSTPGTPVEWGMAVFNTNTGTLVAGNQLMTQSQQSMTINIAGPLTTGLQLVTTAVPSGSSLVSSGILGLTP